MQILPTSLRLAVTDDGKLSAYRWYQKDNRPKQGDLYWARVTRVVESIQGAFLELDDRETGFLNRKDLPTAYSKTARNTIAGTLKQGGRLLVQVIREAEAGKQVKLSAAPKLKGFHLIHLPLESGVFYSRKLTADRKRLQADIEAYPDLQAGGGWIVRSSAQSLTRERLWAEMDRLRSLFAACIQEGPSRLLWRLDPLLDLLQDLDQTQIAHIYLDDEQAHAALLPRLRESAPTLAGKLRLHLSPPSLFSVYKLESALDNLRKGRVLLRSGGSLEIHHTPAAWLIDVNTGKKVKRQSNALLKTNLEAAERIAAQIRLRGLAGLIVIDFIDLTEPAQRRQVDQALKHALKGDDAKMRLEPMNAMGIVTISRAKKGPALAQVEQQRCPQCGGSGKVARLAFLALQIQTALLQQANGMRGETFYLNCAQAAAAYLQKRFNSLFAAITNHLEINLIIQTQAERDYDDWELALNPAD